MSILPDRVDELIAFCSSHQKAWANAPTSIGLTALQVTALGTQVGAAQAAVEGQQSAKDAAKAATTAARNEVSDLRTSAADLVRAIKSYAEIQADPEAVYAAAQIPPPAPPGPTPPPGTPFDLSVELLGNGALRLKWKCNNPSGTQGTIYEVFRKIGAGGGAGEFQYAGSIGTRSFTDETLPAGSSPVTYQITAVRSTQRGNPAQFVVNFGVSGGGGLTIASISSGNGDVKMAA
jgi:hypothetical protein